MAVLVLVAVATLLAGLVLGWALAGRRSAAVAGERDTARAERDTARAEREAARAEAVTLRGERDQLAVQLRAAEVQAAESAGRLATLAQAEKQLQDVFARLSSEALQRSNQQFLELADARLRQVGTPLTDTLAKVELQLREIEKDRAGAQQALAKQIDLVRQTGEGLRQETASLVDALRKPQARGRWGELQLRRCVDYAGMLDRCDFTEQVTVSTADGVLRPDLVVHLVGGKSIVVDSKVTLAAYLEAHEATDTGVREERLGAHARHLRQHVEALAAKSYWAQFSPAPEFVVLFVPGEAFLAPALERDPSLLDDAFAKRVHLATPTTLVSLLRTAAYAWQQDALADNAREVFDVGRELYTRIGRLGAKVETLGKRLGSAVGAYNETVGSLERMVLPQARRFRDLKVVDAELPSIATVDEPVRGLVAPELVEDAEQRRGVVALPGPAGAASDPPGASTDVLPHGRSASG